VSVDGTVTLVRRGAAGAISFRRHCVSRMRISQRLSRCPRCTIAAFGACFAICIVALFVLELRTRHQAAIEGAKESASNFARILAEHTARAFESVDSSLREAERIRLGLAAHPDQSVEDDDANRKAANQALRYLQQTSPLLVSIGWTDAAGNLLAHSNDRDPPRSNIGDTPHFLVQRDAVDDKLYIAQPYRSPVSGNWLVMASRHLTNPDGSFAGIVGAVLDQSYFSSIYRSIKLGRNGAVLVVNRSGTVLVREPLADNIFTTNYANGALLSERLPKAEFGTYETVSIIDGVSRILGYQTVPGLPLVVVVSYDRADVLAPWYRHLYTLGLLTALVVLVFIVGTILLMVQARNLANKTDILEATLENMTHGLGMFDATQKLTICNRRFVQMYGLSSEQTKPGATLRSILEAWVFEGRTPEAARSYIDRRLEEVASNRPHYAVNELPDGRVVSVTIQPIATGGWVAIHQDITDRRRDEEKVAFMAHHDLLTGVANRTYFVEKLADAAARLRRRDEPFTVMVLDLDRFKTVNDSLGHPAGDALLKETARRLQSTLREVDVLARLGGDEFAIILCGEPNQQDAAVTVANRIIDVITETYDINGDRVNIGTSIGIALAPTDGCDPDTLMKRADLALYRAKSDGRNGYRFFDPHMTADVEARRQMEVELRAALAANELEVHYQPIIDVKTGKLASVEALVRWCHPTKGYIPPADFIPLAEDTGLINSLGEWVLQRACSDAAGWPSHIKVAVNISAIQFRKCNLLDVILCVLVDTALPPQRLELEITETALLENEAAQLTVMRQLKNLGVSFSLDDFGTGYSSLSYLTMFPFDKIKIDRSFTKNLTQRADCAAIVSSVLALGAGLDVPTVAEGVETVQQFEILRASGVLFAQGYLFSPARRASELDFEYQWTSQKPQPVGLENVA
jgi:diguanylate cyclase (GGDEF)-like protein/PAS domain S-box-containing protein